MALIHSEVGTIIPRNLRLEALSTLQCLNRLIDNSDTRDSQFEDIINELKFLKYQIPSPSFISTIYGTNNLGREVTEDSLLIANINDALFRAENIVKQQNSDNFKFNGNPVEWFRFLEIFEKTVHNRSDISDTLKFKYLKSMLEGLPLEKIKELPLHDSSYLNALELLRLTFKNEKVLFETHLYALFDLESPEGLQESLSKFRSEFAYHVRALNTLKSDFEESSGFLIAELLKRKLPKEIRDRIGKKNKDNFWTLSKFKEALDYEIGFLSAVEYGSEIEQSQNSNPNEKNIPPLMNGSDSEELRNYLKRRRIYVKKDKIKQNRGNKRKLKQKTPEKLEEIKGNLSEKLHTCKFCELGHFERSCKIYKTGLERRKRASELHLCLRCLSNTHPTKKCKNKLECRYCTGRHLHAICLNLGKIKSMSAKAESGEKSNIKNSRVQLPKKKSNISSRLQFPTIGTT